jgi:hypothetical protein
VLLLHQEQPGKTNALLTAASVFRERGEYPQWITQVDADSRISPNAVSTLIDRAEAQGAMAAAGRLDFTSKDGGKLFGAWIPFVNHPMRGALVTSRTPAWVAGFETIKHEFPQATTEDKLYTAMLRVAGFRVDSGDFDELLGSTPEPDSRQEYETRMTRFMAGDQQAEAIYGRAVLGHLELMRTFKSELKDLAKSLARPKPFGHALAVSARKAGRVTRGAAKHPAEALHNARPTVQGYVSYMRAARKAPMAAQKAEEGGVYSWTPPRMDLEE